MPVDTHLSVSKTVRGEGTLTPFTLEVTAKALVAGICIQLHVWGVGPLFVVEEAHSIPHREICDPPLYVLPKLCAQFDSVMQEPCLLGHINDVAKEGPAWRAHPANEMEFTNQREFLAW